MKRLCPQQASKKGQRSRVRRWRWNICHSPASECRETDPSTRNLLWPESNGLISIVRLFQLIQTWCFQGFVTSLDCKCGQTSYFFRFCCHCFSRGHFWWLTEIYWLINIFTSRITDVNIDSVLPSAPSICWEIPGNSSAVSLSNFTSSHPLGLFREPLKG